MTSDGVAAARKRIQSLLKERREAFAREVTQTREEFGNSIRSSGYVLTIRRLSSVELDFRAQQAWAIIRSVVDNEGWAPNNDHLSHVETELRAALGDGSSDIQAEYENAGKMIRGNWPGLDEARDQALEKALADAEIDQLGRRARHVPLLDHLAAPRYVAAQTHWRKALDFAANDPPDYPNAIKEVVSAVESLAQIVLGKSGVTLGDSIKELRSRKRIPVGADKVLEGLSTLANATPGTRQVEPRLPPRRRASGGLPSKSQKQDRSFFYQLMPPNNPLSRPQQKGRSLGSCVPMPV